MIDKKELVKAAEDAMALAYTPYSKFKVGAALLCKNGKIYTGCNIENASYTPTVCAERVAVFRAIHDGEREFSAIAIVGGHDGVLSGFTYPCGVCRQVLREFCTGDMKLIFSDGAEIKEHTLDEMMPFSFTPEDLKRND